MDNFRKVIRLDIEYFCWNILNKKYFIISTTFSYYNSIVVSNDCPNLKKQIFSYI